MDYEPAVYCKFKRGNRRDGFPGAFRSLKGGTMHACDAGRADAICGSGMMKRTLPPFVKQLLIDLRDKVWALAKRERRTERFFCWREITNGTTACLDTAVDCLDDSSSR